MKKIFALCLVLFAGTSVFAQEDVTNIFQFCDADGNVIENGSVLTRDEIEEYPFGSVDFDNSVIVPSGLYMKTTDADAGYYVGISYTISEISRGSHQICFPITCISERTAGTYDTSKGQIAEGALSDMQTEWLTGGYGTCTVTYTIHVYEYASLGRYNEVGEGSTITVNYVYADPAGIESTEAGKTVVSSKYYDLNGCEISEPVKGLYIQKSKLSDGTYKTTKILK
ncbi:MAG: hypothetical protein Q4D41_05115 [Prevotellaceae bacterium]|nr:hypothetical protein [Prevotellaceae bacterium]